MTRSTSPASRPHLEWPKVNVAEGERIISAAAGGLLLLNALRGHREGRALSLLCGAALLWRGVSGHCSLYAALGTCGIGSPSKGVAAKHGVKFETAVLVNQPANELYEQWIQLESLPRFMSHLVSVSPNGEGKTHWVATAPFGLNLEWDAEIIEQRTNEVISWQSLPGSQVDTAGSVHFRALPNRGTEVRVSLKYDPPGGAITAQLADFFGAGIQQSVEADLWRFKQWCETGEIPTTEGQSSGRESHRNPGKLNQEARV